MQDQSVTGRIPVIMRSSVHLLIIRELLYEKNLEVLIAGGSICQKIEEDLTYDYLHSSEDNLWSILYLTGYLTKVGERDKDGQIELRIPKQRSKRNFRINRKEMV